MICEAQCLHSTSDEPPFVESALLIDYIYKAKDSRKRRSSGSGGGANTDLNTPNKRIKSLDSSVNTPTNLLSDTSNTTTNAIIHKKFYSFAERYWFNNEYNHQKGLKLGQGKDSPVSPSDVILANVANFGTGDEEAAYGDGSGGEVKIRLPEGSGMHMRFDSTNNTTTNTKTTTSTSCTTTTDTITTVVTSEGGILVQSE